MALGEQAEQEAEVEDPQQDGGWSKKTRTRWKERLLTGCEMEPEVLVPHPEIRSGCVTWGGVQQSLLEVLWMPEACWQVSGRKGVGMDVEIRLV